MGNGRKERGGGRTADKAKGKGTRKLTMDGMCVFFNVWFVSGCIPFCFFFFLHIFASNIDERNLK